MVEAYSSCDHTNVKYVVFLKDLLANLKFLLLSDNVQIAFTAI